jgi:hypothetical protein
MNNNSKTPATHQLLRFLELMAAAERPFAVLNVVQSYLDAWPKERIASLQSVDGGWAPFDRGLRPLQVNTIGHLKGFRDAVHRQCLALKEANFRLTPEIMELDEILSIASQYAEALRTPEFKERSAAVSRRPALLNLL